MRRILQPWGVDLKQDALIADNDLNVTRTDPDLPNDSNAKVDVGEAKVATKKTGGNKKKKGRGSALSAPPSGEGAPNRVNPTHRISESVLWMSE